MYENDSAGQPGKAYGVTATISWDVTWTATTGESGIITPADLPGNLAVRVTSYQAVITG